MSAGSLGELERGETMNPPLGTILRLMSALEISSLDVLLAGELVSPSADLADLL
jgi:hypothetical protein